MIRIRPGVVLILAPAVRRRRRIRRLVGALALVGLSLAAVSPGFSPWGHAALSLLWRALRALLLP